MFQVFGYNQSDLDLTKEVTLKLNNIINTKKISISIVKNRLLKKRDFLLEYYNNQIANSTCNNICKENNNKRKQDIDYFIDLIIRNIEHNYSKSEKIDFSSFINENKISQMKKISGLDFDMYYDTNLYNSYGYNYDECVGFVNTQDFGNSKCYYYGTKNIYDVQKPLEIFVYRFNSYQEAKQDLEKTDFYGSDKRSSIEINGVDRAVLLKLDCTKKIRTIRAQKNNFVIETKYSMYDISQNDIIKIFSIIVTK